ncbi:MAG: hypothetical protein M1835_004903 [Candelina submexicana]|nr:MAG: hypothetical protein M1835_004903 [Candelina submexicana]
MKSVAITNSYTFEGGISGKPDSQIELAFNFEASYTYSRTSTTAQTLTASRPNRTLDSCGFWTFLPYYIQSCGFFVSQQQVSFAGGIPVTSYQYCKEKQEINFQWNNSTFLDSDGNAEGITLFVATDCATNEKLPLEMQGPTYAQVNRVVYSSLGGIFIPFLGPQGQLLSEFIEPPVAQQQQSGSEGIETQDLCERACFCNYATASRDASNGFAACYPFCAEIFYKLLYDERFNPLQGDTGCPYGSSDPVSFPGTNETQSPLCDQPVTSTNITHMEQIGIDVSDWKTRHYIKEVAEGTPNVTQNPFECFQNVNFSAYGS